MNAGSAMRADFIYFSLNAIKHVWQYVTWHLTSS